MLIPLGILASAGGVPPIGDYELISTTSLTGNAADVTFDVSSFSSTYRHLQVRFASKSNNAAVWEIGLLRLNGDTGANYSVHSLEATYQPSLITRSTGSANTSSMSFSAAGATNAGVFSAAIVDILNAYGARNKTVRLLSSYHQPSAGEYSIRSGDWRNTAGVTSVSIFPLSGTAWLAGSRFSIYGIRG